jgi:hypothetical protein
MSLRKIFHVLLLDEGWRSTTNSLAESLRVIPASKLTLSVTCRSYHISAVLICL